MHVCVDSGPVNLCNIVFVIIQYARHLLSYDKNAFGGVRVMVIIDKNCSYVDYLITCWHF